MALELHFHGPNAFDPHGASIEGWARNGTAGVRASEGNLTAGFYPSAQQAAQIVRALAKFAGLRVLEPTPAEGWDDPSADVMNAEADADAEEHLDRTRPE